MKHFACLFFCFLAFVLLGEEKKEKRIEELRRRLWQARKEGNFEKARRIARRIRQLEMENRWRKRELLFPDKWKHLLVRPARLNLRDIAHYGIAQIYLQNNQFGKAIGELKKVVKNSPYPESRSAAQLSIGNLYLAQRKFAQAILNYLQVSPPFRKRAFFLVFRVFKRLQAKQDIASLSKKILSLCRDEREKAYVHLFFAHFYMRKKEYQKALHHLSEITKLPYPLLEPGRRKKTPSLKEAAQK